MYGFQAKHESKSCKNLSKVAENPTTNLAKMLIRTAFPANQIAENLAKTRTYGFKHESKSYKNLSKVKNRSKCSDKPLKTNIKENLVKTAVFLARKSTEKHKPFNTKNRLKSRNENLAKIC